MNQTLMRQGNCALTETSCSIDLFEIQSDGDTAFVTNRLSKYAFVEGGDINGYTIINTLLAVCGNNGVERPRLRRVRFEAFGSFRNPVQALLYRLAL